MATEKPKRHFLITEVELEEKMAVERHAKMRELSVSELVRDAVRMWLTSQVKEKVA